MHKKIIFLLIILMFVLVGCRQKPLTSDDVTISLDFAPDTFQVGETTIIVSVMDKEGHGIDNANVNIRGDMSHAGMQPVIRDIVASENGVYEAGFEWTMAGDWQVEVMVTLPGGAMASDSFAFTVEGDMGDMSSMNMEATDEAGMNMDGMDMEATDEAEMDMNNMDMDSTEEASMDMNGMDMNSEATEEASGN